MPGRIKFEYRSLYDVVIAHVDWQLETVEDVERWARQYETYFKSRFSRKVDLILELSKFRLPARLAPQFREARNRILRDFTNHSYRVKEPPKERAMMYAGFVLTGGPANHFDSMEDALKALLADREKESEPHSHGSGEVTLQGVASGPQAQPRRSSRPR
jgi:hypothetical protein